MPQRLQVNVQQQPTGISTEAVQSHGINTCGILGPFYFRRFLRGVEANGPSALSCLETWLDSCLCRPVQSVVMEAARAAGMRYLLHAICQYGSGKEEGSMTKELGKHFREM